MAKEIYVVTMENDEMDTTEIGYASNQQIADRMIKKASSTDGFEFFKYHSFKAPVDYMEINDEPVSFEKKVDEGNDLVVQFAILWGMQIGSAFSSKEIEIAEEMKQWDSDELFKLFSAWKTEYFGQDIIEDSAEFFQKKLVELLYE